MLIGAEIDKVIAILMVTGVLALALARSRRILYRAVLDSVLAALDREPYVRGLVSYPGTSDTTFLSRDRRSTFVLVAIDLEDGDSAGAYVPPTRATVRGSAAGAAASPRRRGSRS